MTAQAIAAAGEAQPELPLLKLLGDWEAVSAMFLAPPLDLGFGGGGSARRMAVTQLIDMPKVKGEKRSGVKRAREKVRAMGDDEVKELASKRASAIGEASFHTRPPPLPQFALAPTRRPHLHAYRPPPSARHITPPALPSHASGSVRPASPRLAAQQPSPRPPHPRLARATAAVVNYEQAKSRVVLKPDGTAKSSKELRAEGGAPLPPPPPPSRAAPRHPARPSPRRASQVQLARRPRARRAHNGR